MGVKDKIVFFMRIVSAAVSITRVYTEHMDSAVRRVYRDNPSMTERDKAKFLVETVVENESEEGCLARVLLLKAVALAYKADLTS